MFVNTAIVSDFIVILFYFVSGFILFCFWNVPEGAMVYNACIVQWSLFDTDMLWPCIAIL